MVSELGWRQLAWHRVGAEFSRICGPKRYRSIIERGETRKLLVYVIPPEGEITSQAERASHPAAPLPMRLQSIEQTIARLADQVEALANSLGSGRPDPDAQIVRFSDRRA